MNILSIMSTTSTKYKIYNLISSLNTLYYSTTENAFTVFQQHHKRSMSKKYTKFHG